jgi:hypothetical protein
MARFWQRWPEEGDPAAAAVRGTGRGAAAVQGVGLRLFFYSRDRGCRRPCWSITVLNI